MRRLMFLSVLLSICLASSSKLAVLAGDDLNRSTPKSANAIKWQEWSDNIFKESKAQNKLVILDLHAVWCHWCHVMDEKTYSNAAVQKMIGEHFIPVSVDQDSRPDLANRYEDYGWPATIIFTPEGKERKLLSGFLPADELLAIMQECVKSPNQASDALSQSKEKFSDATALEADLKKELSKRFVETYDTNNGGWTFGHKYLPRENVEYAMTLAFHGDKSAEQRAKEVLALQVNLLDPVWGGMYQYSTDDDWKHPHFEKIMEVQAGNLRVYSLAYLLWKDPEHLQVAEKIAAYLQDFLCSPDGAFYTSQDADVVQGKHSNHYFSLDDKGRRKTGIPRIDKHIYSRENGWAIEALTYLYAASGDKKYLEQAEKAAKWICVNRMDGDHFRHGGHQETQNFSGNFFGDNLGMGRAFLSLYAATGDRHQLELAEKVSDYIGKTFVVTASSGGASGVASTVASSGAANTASSGASDKSAPGFITVSPPSAAGNAINMDENISAARFFAMLSHYSGRAADKERAALAMRYVATRSIVKKRGGLVGGVLLADHEFSSDPPHVVVVGSKDDKTAQDLFFQSQKYPLAFKQTEFFDRKDGRLPSGDTEYPDLPKAAAFLCSGNACSAPVYSTEKLKSSLDGLAQ